MDLIYSDSTFKDIGVIQDFILDMAYGQTANAENNFEVRKVLQTPECQAGDYLYVEHTEYGGIIDSIGADTKNNYLIYRGRTWHGLLDSKIIEPEAGRGSYVVSGEANSVVAELIEHCGLDSIFEVSSEDSGIDIDYFEFAYDNNDDRVYLNMGIFAMLQQFDGKLKIVAENGKVRLHVERLMNYATDEFDSSQMKFSLVQVFSHVNHLICLGEGEAEKKHVIHLFADANGGIRPYLIDPTKEPIEDSDYILDKRNQVFFGIDERTEVCDYSEVATVENYKLLTSEPSDWKKNYTNYYEKPDEDEEDNYDQVKPNIQETYSLTESKPSDWNDGYTNYYTRDYNEDTGEDVYNKVPEVVDYDYHKATHKPSDWNEIYTRYFYKEDGDYHRAEKVPKYKAVNKQPKDWKKNYGSYYVRDSQDNYSSVSGVSKQRHIYQTVKPSGWEQNWKTASWFIKRKDNKGKVHYVKLGDDSTLSRRKTAPKWKSKTYYVLSSYTVAPSFKAISQVYSMTLKIPTWSARTYYTRTKKENAHPTWEAYKYYRRGDDVDIGIEFKADTYYEKVFDHYAKMIEKAIDVMDDFNDRDELSVDFEENANMYDIGDMVGGTEQVTGLRVAQPIVKKIINIENNLVTIQHLIREVKTWQ